jgi:hypothetical protein
VDVSAILQSYQPDQYTNAPTYATMLPPPPPPPPESDAVVVGAAPANVVADVESFVPAIPKSLLQLAVAGVGAGSNQLSLINSGTYMSAEFTKLTREARRCHVTGFTHGSNRQDIASYFTMIIQDVRRHMLERETQRTIPDNAVIDVDQVVDMNVDAAKSKPFAFVELNNPDLVSELIAQCAEDKDRFQFHCSRDGTSHALMIRRPKDYQVSHYVDPFKVVLQGISTLISDERIKQVMESFGDLKAFERNDKYVYCEFDDVTYAKECVEDLQGQVLQGRVVLALHVDEAMRGILIQSGIRVGEPRSDPNTVGEDGLAVAPLDVNSSKKIDHVREVLEFITTLNQSVLHLKATFPYLEPQFGSNLPVFPTKILVLLNIVDEADIILDEDYSKLLADLSSEVEKYGRVSKLIVPRRMPAPVPPKPLPPKKFEGSRNAKQPQRQVNVLPLQNPFENAPAPEQPPATSSSVDEPEVEDEYQIFLREKEEEEKRYQAEKDAYHKAREAWQASIQHPVDGGIGRVFVEYETVDEAAEAQAALSGKLFRHRAVVTSFLFEDVLYPPTEADAEEEARQAEAAVEAYLNKETGAATATTSSGIAVDESAAPGGASAAADDID